MLLNKNSEGEITFVLTHSDVLNESEIAKNGAFSSRLDLALKRAQEVRWKFVQDMEKDLWTDAGAQTAQQTQTSAASAFGCFCVSATDYLRVAGLDVHKPLTFNTTGETQIPGLRKQMHMQVLKRQIDSVSNPLNLLCATMKTIVAHLQDPGTHEEHRRQKCEEITSRHVRIFQTRIQDILSSWEQVAMSNLQSSLAAKVRAGAASGKAQAESTSNEWAVHSNYHHMTYKGMVRRDCEWSHPTKGNLDWPEELAAPVYDKWHGPTWELVLDWNTTDRLRLNSRFDYRGISPRPGDPLVIGKGHRFNSTPRFGKDWRQLFGQVLPGQVAHVKQRLREASEHLHRDLRHEVLMAGCRGKDELDALQGSLAKGTCRSDRVLGLRVYPVMIVAPLNY